MQDFEKTIRNFEKLQADYQSALSAKQAHEDNQRREREAYFQAQQLAYEEGQKRDRRCQSVQKFIDILTEVIQQMEWGHAFDLNEKLQNLAQNMDFQIRNRLLHEGR